jgi:hypothetical protein
MGASEVLASGFSAIRLQKFKMHLLAAALIKRAGMLAK